MGGAFELAHQHTGGLQAPSALSERVLFSLRRCETHQVRRILERVVFHSQPGAPDSPKRGWGQETRVGRTDNP